MRNEENGAPAPADILHSIQALSLETSIANRQHFIHQQNLRLQISSDGECQTNIHPTSVSLDRRIDKLSDFRERYDIIEFPSDLCPNHAEARPTHLYIFPTTTLTLKTS